MNANQFNSTILVNKQHNSAYLERFGFSNRSKLTKGLLFSPTSFMSVNILLHNSATVIVLSTGRIVHGTICLERNYISLRYVFKPLKIKTKHKNPSHVGLEIKTKNKNPTYLALFLKSIV
jgi:hypothetical protein